MSDPGPTDSFVAPALNDTSMTEGGIAAPALTLAELPLQDILGQAISALVRLRELRDQIDSTEPGLSPDAYLLIEDLTDHSACEPLNSLIMPLYSPELALPQIAATESAAIPLLRALKDRMEEPVNVALMAQVVSCAPEPGATSSGAESLLDVDGLDGSFDAQDIIASRYRELARACAHLPALFAAILAELDARSARRALGTEPSDDEQKMLDTRQQSFAALNRTLEDLDDTRQALEDAWAGVGEAVALLGVAITGIQTAVRRLPAGADIGARDLRRKLAVGVLNWSQLLIYIRRIGFDRPGVKNPERTPTALLTALSYVPENCGKTLDVLEAWSAEETRPDLEPVQNCLEEIVTQALTIVQASQTMMSPTDEISHKAADLEADLEDLLLRVRDATTPKEQSLGRSRDITEQLPKEPSQRYVGMPVAAESEGGSSIISLAAPEGLVQWLNDADFLDFTPRYENLRLLVQAELDKQAGNFLASLLKDLRDELKLLNEARALAREESTLTPDLDTSDALILHLNSLVAGFEAYLPAACASLCDLIDSFSGDDVRRSVAGIAILRLADLCEDIWNLIHWANRNPWGTEYRDALATAETWANKVRSSASGVKMPAPDKAEWKAIWQHNLATLNAAYESASHTQPTIIPVHLQKRTNCNYVILGKLHSWKWLRACDWQGTLELKGSRRGWPKVRGKLAKLPLPRKLVARGSAHIAGSDPTWYPYLAAEIGRRCNIRVTHD